MFVKDVHDYGRKGRVSGLATGSARANQLICAISEHDGLSQSSRGGRECEQKQTNCFHKGGGWLFPRVQASRSLNRDRAACMEGFPMDRRIRLWCPSCCALGRRASEIWCRDRYIRPRDTVIRPCDACCSSIAERRSVRKRTAYGGILSAARIHTRSQRLHSDRA